MNKIGGESNTEFSNLDSWNRTCGPIQNGEIEKPKTYNWWSRKQKVSLLDEVRLSSGN